MEMEEMMACLLAKMKPEIRTNQAKADDNLKEMMEDMTASQELLKEEMLAKLNAHHKRVMARMDSQLEKMEAVEDVFDKRFNKMDITLLEANRGRSETVAKLQDTPKEEAVVETIEALEK
jgi:hypothetical protein